MKPEYIGFGNFDTINYAYAYCNCPLSVDYAIKWSLIKDGKPHSYTCTCEDCGKSVSVIAKSCRPEVYKEIQPDGKNDVLDKIRAEIVQRPYGIANDSVIQGIKYERADILEIIDKYKTESEGENYG